MPKAILEFSLPEEAEEYKLALKAGEYQSILWEVSNYARSLRKYEERDSIPTQEIVDKLNELLADYEY